MVFCHHSEHGMLSLIGYVDGNVRLWIESNPNIASILDQGIDHILSASDHDVVCDLRIATVERSENRQQKIRHNTFHCINDHVTAAQFTQIVNVAANAIDLPQCLT